jgi:acetolactate synthase-1/2/3 large subunit
MENWKAEALSRKDSQPISPRWLLHKANEILPANSYILTETATHSTLVQRYMANPNGFFKVISGGLGMGLGEAVGVKLALPNRPVVFIAGDGSFIYNPVLAGLGLCQEYHLPIFIIILNNGVYASMRSIHEKYYPKGWSASGNMYIGVDLAPVTDYAKMAEAFDAYGERVKSPNEIEPAMKRALQQMAKGRSVILDVMLDPLDTGGYASIGTRRE